MTDYPALFSLKGKVIVVCGAAGLVGSEISRAVASAGARVIVADVQASKAKALVAQITKAGHQAQYAPFDITALNGVEAKIERLLKEYGACHGWVNAAYPRTEDWPNAVEKLNIASWKRNVDMHLNGYVWTTRAVALWMKAHKVKGSIVNLGSIYGVQANDFTVYEGTPLTSPMAYAAIKGGITNAGRYIAAYFGPDGIRCNTVCPGGIYDSQNKRFVKQYQHKVPLKRMGTPKDVAGGIIYLLSDASVYVTGTTFMIDGGWSIV